MGYVDYSAADWKSYAEAHITGRTSVSGTNGLFSATKMADDMNPKKLRNVTQYLRNVRITLRNVSVASDHMKYASFPIY